MPDNNNYLEANKSNAINLKNNRNSILKLFNPLKDYGEVIYKLSCNNYYVYENQNILELSNELEKHNDIFAIGVVDDERKVSGIIVKEELSLILSKMHGRDVFMNRKVSSIMQKTKTFSEDMSILQAAEELKNELKLIDNHYYITINSNNQFTGVFSTKSILIYLSEITQKDLLLAQKIQRGIVNEEFNLNTDKIKLTAVSKMASDVGGDFYTVKKYNNDKWIILICDVSGKGINASLLTCIIGGILSAYDFNKGLNNFILILNDYILKTFKLEKFITGIIMEYNEVSREAIIYDMGHSFLYVCRNKNIFRLKQHSDNLPAGIKQKYEPKSVKIKLGIDDLLIIYTDGLIEQTNKYGKAFSDDRLKKILKNNTSSDIGQVKNKILDDFNEFKGKYRQIDDLTFIILK